MANPELAKLSKGFLDVTPAEVGDALVKFYAAAMQMTAAIVAQGQALGAVRDDLDPTLLSLLAFNLGETMDRWWLSYFEAETLDDTQIAEIVALYLDVFKRLLLPTHSRG